MSLLMYCSFTTSAKAKARTYPQGQAVAFKAKAKTSKDKVKTKAKAGILWPLTKTKTKVTSLLAGATHCINAVKCGVDDLLLHAKFHLHLCRIEALEGVMGHSRHVLLRFLVQPS